MVVFYIVKTQLREEWVAVNHTWSRGAGNYVAAVELRGHRANNYDIILDENP
jgi:hypothetical protein